MCFLKVKLAPEKEASDLLPYQPESDSPRLLELPNEKEAWYGTRPSARLPWRHFAAGHFNELS